MLILSTSSASLVPLLMKAFIGIPNDSALLHELMPKARLATDHVSIWTGPYNYYSGGIKHSFLSKFLQDAIVDDVTTYTCTANANCTQFGQNFYCDEVCKHSESYFHPAYSLAYNFKYSDVSWSVNHTNKVDPVLAEADWTSPELRLIFLPPPMLGRITCGIGIFLYVFLSVLASYLWKRNHSYFSTK